MCIRDRKKAAEQQALEEAELAAKAERRQEIVAAMQEAITTLLPKGKKKEPPHTWNRTKFILQNQSLSTWNLSLIHICLPRMLDFTQRHLPRLSGSLPRKCVERTNE